MLNFVAFVLIHPPHRRIALSLELVFQMMAKHFAALTDKVHALKSLRSYSSFAALFGSQMNGVRQVWRRLIKNQLRGSLSLKRKRLNVPETREPCSVKAIRSSVHCSISYVP